MKRKKVRMAIIALLVTVSLPFFSYSQQPDTLIKKLDSLAQKSDSVKPNNTAPSAYNETTKINVPTYFILLGSNFKQAFTKPFHMKPRDGKYLGIGIAVTGVITLVDRPVQQAALRIRNANPPLQTISKYVTNFGGPYEAYTLGALGYTALFSKTKK